MARFNRIVAILLWIVLLVVLGLFIIFPQLAIDQIQSTLATLSENLDARYAANSTNFMIGQAALAILALLLFGLLLWLEVAALLRPTVSIRTAEGSLAEVETTNIGQQLGWQLDQVGDIQTVVPIVRARGGKVNIKLEIEATSGTNATTKTDEVIEVTRDLIEDELGLTLGKLDVQMRLAPFEVPAN